jgi:hypothetical protein
LADRIIRDWVRSNGINDLRITAKVGSINNNGDEESNLSFGHLGLLFEYYSGAFAENLSSMMVHWDNRGSQEAVNETIEFLRSIASTGVTPGLSGINNPILYSPLILDEVRVPIQCKRNFFVDESERYHNFIDHADFYLYGINLGGVHRNGLYNPDSTFSLREMRARFNSSDLRTVFKLLDKFRQNSNSPINESFDLSFAYALNCRNAYGIILGPSSVIQLKRSLSLFNRFTEGPIQGPIHGHIKNEAGPLIEELSA